MKDQDRDVPMMNEEILNVGLELAMAWGEDWLQPIQERLRLKYPSLRETELDEYNDVCQTVMKEGHHLAREAFSIRASAQEKRKARDKFELDLARKHPWVNTDNTGKLYSQGTYYAMK